MNAFHAGLCLARAQHYLSAHCASNVVGDEKSAKTELFHAIDAITEAINSLGYVMIRTTSAKEATAFAKGEAAL